MNPLNAGLIIDISPAIDAAGILGLSFRGGNLIVESQDGSATVKLPAGALPLLALWARKYGGGPLVFSGEIERMSSASNRYSPPSTPKELIDAMFEYDSFHATLSCGASSERHPLFARNGDYSAFPAEQYALLVDDRNGSASAFWYRQLASRYLAPPECTGGEITVKALNAKGPLPVRLEIQSYRYVQTSVWYHHINTMDDFESWVAHLPYEPLRKDVETRWDEYRKSFPPIEELSSIIEALAVLQAVYHQNPTLWTTFSKALLDSPNGFALKPLRVGNPFATERWTYATRVPAKDPRWWEIVQASLDRDEGSNGNPELSLAVVRLNSENLRVMRDRIEAAAKVDPAFDTKWTLERTLTAMKTAKSEKEIVDAVRLAQKFFDQAGKLDDGFRLRVDGYTAIETSLPEKDDNAKWRALSELLAAQRTRIVADFVTRVEKVCSDGTAPVHSDAVFWENLSDDVYSTGLLDLATEDFELNPEVANAVACIHYRRGMAPHPGKDLFFRHAHFRFLKYLAERRPDDEALAARIRSYRGDIARLIGLQNWNEDEVSADDNAVWEPEKLEGTLMPALCLFQSNPEQACDTSALQNGQPAGILANGHFTVLLAGADVLAKPCDAGSSRPAAVRVKGLRFDDGRSFAPETMEASCAGGWRQIALPSPTSTPLTAHPPTEHVTGTEPQVGEMLEGILVEARCYFAAGAISGDSRYCGFLGMKSNLPAGILTAGNVFVYLAAESFQLADYMGRFMRVRGTVIQEGRLVKPAQIWVQSPSGHWEAVAF